MMPGTTDAIPPDLETARAYFDRFVQARHYGATATRQAV